MFADLSGRASKISIVLMDVDGVLTDGRFYMVPDGTGCLMETKAFDAQDGLALQWLKWMGIRAGLISGRSSPATAYRAATASFEFVYQGHLEKTSVLQEILKKADVDPACVAYIGDDLTDVAVMRRVGLGIATANARAEVKREAHYVTHAFGGRGAVREAVEMIAKGRGIWHKLLERYEVSGQESRP